LIDHKDASKSTVALHIHPDHEISPDHVTGTNMHKIIWVPMEQASEHVKTRKGWISQADNKFEPVRSLRATGENAAYEVFEKFGPPDKSFVRDQVTDEDHVMNLWKSRQTEPGRKDAFDKTAYHPVPVHPVVALKQAVKTNGKLVDGDTLLDPGPDLWQIMASVKYVKVPEFSIPITTSAAGLHVCVPVMLAGLTSKSKIQLDTAFKTITVPEGLSAPMICSCVSVLRN
jgi:hypothetical protein